MLKLFVYLKKYKLLIPLCFILLFAQAICELNLPNLMSDIIDVGILNRDVNYIINKGSLMLLVTLISVVSHILVGFLAIRIATGTGKLLRKAIFEKVESFSHNEIDHFSTSSLITRTTNDVTQIQSMIVSGILMMCYAPIMGIGGIIMARSKSMNMGWTIALNVIILMTLIVSTLFIVVPKFKKVQKLIDKLNLIARENLSGIMVIRAFSTQRFEENRFDKTNLELTKTSRLINNVLNFLSPAIMFIMDISGILIIYVGSHKVAQGSMQVGDMMAFMQYAIQIIISFWSMSIMFVMVPRATVSAKRIAEVLNTNETIKDPINITNVQNTSNQCEVSFEHVYFKYLNAEDNVVENISFTAKPGQTTAIVGSTGSGKSTLANLILRFYDVTSGKIKINGVDIKQMSQKNLRDLIGYVPQKGVLFSGTIASNLRYGNENADEKTLERASKVAKVLDFVKQNDNTFDHEISQNGTNVSGGQKQRLSIARALVKNAPIYIFDDSFSALDFKTDSQIRKNLKKYTANSTVIIIAQRISTIMNAEQIIVLDNGKIVGKGTHKELLKQCKTYREIAESQLSKEELQ